MAELPSDPEELARLILTGHVSIQQLAQEKARRQAAGAAQSAIRPSPPRQSLGRIAPAKKATSYQQPGQPARPAPRTVPFPAPPSPVSRPVAAARVRQPAAAPGQPHPGGSGSRSSQRDSRPGGAKPIAGGAKPATGGATAASVQGPAGPRATAPVTAPGTIAVAMLKDSRYLRSAFILTEILGKPLALRGDSAEY